MKNTDIWAAPTESSTASSTRSGGAGRSGRGIRSRRAGTSTELPSWPLTAMLAFYPLWWVLGFGSTAWIPLAACMALLMIRRGGIRVPRGFGIWLLFLLLMAVSVIGIDSGGRVIGFVYRAMQYASVTIVLVYVYNARARITRRYALGLVTLFWGYAVIGGFAGIFFPTFSFATPLSYVLPAGLQQNEVVGEMVVRRLTQHNPDSWIALDPRPSAPFLYTNQWGNVYSLTLPMVFAYLGLIRRGWKFFGVVVGIALSLIPALLTLNRGMFIGLGVAGLYLLARFLLAGRWPQAIGLGAAGVAAVITAIAIDVGDRLAERMETSSSTDDRADLYQETFARTLQSPLFGYGAPRPSGVDGLPSAGTQGQIWTVMFSYGFPALICFMLALVWLFVATARVSDASGLILNTVQLVTLVEVLYYGVLPNGLMLSFLAAGLALRERGPSCASRAPGPFRAQKGLARDLSV